MKKNATVCIQTNKGVRLNEQGVCVQTNTKDNTLYDCSVNNSYKKTKKTDFDVLIDEYTCNDKLKESIYEFIKMRKANKKPLTPYGLKKILNKLDALATDDDSKIQILDQSIERSWAGVFELKDNKGGNNNGGTQQNIKNPYDDLPEIGITL